MREGWKATYWTYLTVQIATFWIWNFYQYLFCFPKFLKIFSLISNNPKEMVLGSTDSHLTFDATSHFTLVRELKGEKWFYGKGVKSASHTCEPPLRPCFPPWPPNTLDILPIQPHTCDVVLMALNSYKNISITEISSRKKPFYFYLRITSLPSMCPNIQIFESPQSIFCSSLGSFYFENITFK